jgi:hypothetical protein
MPHGGAERVGARTQGAGARWQVRRWSGGSLAVPAGAQRGRVPRAVGGQGAQGPQASRRRHGHGSVAAPWSERQVAARREEPGGPMAHATSQRWGVPYRPPLAEACDQRQRPVGGSWRMDETAFLRPHRATLGPCAPLMGRGN